jgi:hypothetical protein
MLQSLHTQDGSLGHRSLRQLTGHRCLLLQTQRILHQELDLNQ